MTEPEHRITAIQRQKRNPERVSISLDGAFAFGVPATAVIDHALRVGEILSPAVIADLKAIDETAKATDVAIRLLTSRPRAVKEIERHLAKKSYDDETIALVIQRLRDWRYIDDESFARAWVENRDTHRPRGRQLIEQELRAKGVERETITTALDEADIDEFAGALSIATTKLRSYRDLEPAVAQRRLAAFLGRRGYRYDVIKPVLAELFGETEEEDVVDG